MFRYVLMFLTVTNIYLYLKLRSGFGKGLWNFIYIIWAIAWAVMSFTARSDLFGMGENSEVVYSLAFTRAAIVGIACAAFLFLDIASLAAQLFDSLAGTSYKTRFFNPRKYVPVTILLVLAVAFYSYYEAWNIRRIDHVIETSKLQEGIDRLRLVHVTDVHLDNGLFSVPRLRKVMKIVREAEPDILVITGDHIDSRTSPLEEEAKHMALNGAKYGVYAVTGNHEFISGRITRTIDFMERSNIVLLRDAKADVAGITILGVDDQMRWRTQWPDDMNNQNDKFVLVLKHRPGITEGSEGKFDLQLSGHTHGGQIWPFGYATQKANKQKQGLSYKGTSAIYVSNGAGSWGPSLRFLTPPEVTVIDLVKP
jgi:predicted MPP superfamily phosphohydrolase